MGNNTSKDITKKDVQNHIENELNINNNVINDFYHQTTNNLMTEMVNTNDQSVKVNLQQMNRLIVGTLIADGGTIDICQNNDLVSRNASIMNVLQNTEGQNQIITDLNASFSNSMATNAQLAAAMESNSAITDTIKSAGGIASMVDSIMSTISDLGKQIGQNDTTKDIETKIITAVKQKYNISNNVTNKTRSIITNAVQNIFKNNSNSKCVFSTTQINELQTGAAIAKNGGKISLCQENSLNAISECVIGSIQSESMSNGLTTTDKISATTEIKNTGEANANLKATTGISTTKEMGSAFEDMIKSFSPAACGGVCIVYCIVLALIIGAMFLLKGKGGGNE
jgi:hypothetical protein